MSERINLTGEINLQTITDFIDLYTSQENIHFGNIFFNDDFKSRLIDYIFQNKLVDFKLDKESQIKIIHLMDQDHRTRS